MRPTTVGPGFPSTRGALSELGALLLAASAVLSCGGISDNPGEGSPVQGAAGSPGGGSSSVAAGGAAAEGTAVGGSTAGTGGSATGTAGGVSGACTAPEPARAALRRLSAFQYNNTVRDVLGDTSSPAAQLLPEGGLFDAPSDEVHPLQIEIYNRLAHDFALRSTRDAASLDRVMDCELATHGEIKCETQFLTKVIERLFRRPFNADDLSELKIVFETGRELGGDFASGVRAVLEVGLQSPEFLYRVELGDVAAEPNRSVRPLLPHETANRLSYLLWGSAPDTELLAAAQADELRSKAQVQTQARRMLKDERAREMVRHFYFALLGVQPAAPQVDSALHPHFTPQIAELMREETRHFIDEVTWVGPGTIHELYTAPFTWMNGPLASYYGVSGITGDAFRRVELDGARRGGLLTQGSFMAFGGSTTRPVVRGALIASRFLCLPLEPPPPNVEVVLAPQPSGPLTTRQRLQIHSSVPSCSECHQHIDPLGFAFEHFDAAGRLRDTESGLPIDATGVIHKTDAAGSFDGATELGARLAGSEDVANCLLSNWMRFAYGETAGTTAAVVNHDDVCARQQLKDAFARSRGSVRELLVELTQTDAFSSLPVEQNR